MTDGAGNGGAPSIYWTIEGGRGRFIADGGMRFVIGGHIGIANARLIRYAPELLEALQNVLGFCATNQGTEAVQAIDDARIVLAKLGVE